MRVDSILDGCVLHEDYRDEKGYRGERFTIYDQSRNLWHQTWVTNHGKLLVIEGRMQSGDMILSGVERTADGSTSPALGSRRRAESAKPP